MGVRRRLGRLMKSRKMSAGRSTPLSVNKCDWNCTTSVCEETCEPVCSAPTCETRCSVLDLSACHLDCNHADCVTVCPHNCTQGPCLKKSCRTECGNPKCKLNCPKEQECKKLCSTP